jgi:hypothetical protein
LAHKPRKFGRDCFNKTSSRRRLSSNIAAIDDRRAKRDAIDNVGTIVPVNDCRSSFSLREGIPLAEFRREGLMEKPTQNKYLRKTNASTNP